MDISEKYTRMCALAKEIQHNWSYENGDYFMTPQTAMQACGIGIYRKMYANASGYQGKVSFKSCVQTSMSGLWMFPNTMALSVIRD